MEWRKKIQRWFERIPWWDKLNYVIIENECKNPIKISIDVYLTALILTAPKMLNLISYFLNLSKLFKCSLRLEWYFRNLMHHDFWMRLLKFPWCELKYARWCWHKLLQKCSGAEKKWSGGGGAQHQSTALAEWVWGSCLGIERAAWILMPLFTHSSSSSGSVGVCCCRTSAALEISIFYPRRYMMRCT